jgi:hypothetical protein
MCVDCVPSRSPVSDPLYTRNDAKKIWEGRGVGGAWLKCKLVSDQGEGRLGAEYPSQVLRSELCAMLNKHTIVRKSRICEGNSLFA